MCNRIIIIIIVIIFITFIVRYADGRAPLARRIRTQLLVLDRQVAATNHKRLATLLIQSAAAGLHLISIYGP